MTVAENLYLLRRRNPFWVNWKSMNRYINNVLRAIGFGLRANSPVRDLSVVQRKIVEILKLAMLDIRVILIDSSICYTEKANAELYDAVRIFCQRGLSFIYFGNLERIRSGKIALLPYDYTHLSILGTRQTASCCERIESWFFAATIWPVM